MKKLIACMAILFIGTAARGQVRYVGPGSTVQGDTAWGGNFSKARCVRPQRSQGDGHQRGYGEEDRRMEPPGLRRIYAGAFRAYRAAEIRNGAIGVEAEKKAAAREEKLRKNPLPDDINKGDALNALLLDLSDPSIGDSSCDWPR